MDLKIKDVADLLNVSETTIRRWLKEGKIPAYQINHQYRFSLMEVEDWVMKQKLGKTEEPAPFNIQRATPKEQSSKCGTKQFSLYRAVHKGSVFHDVPGDTKEEVIRGTMNRMAQKLNFDTDVVTELLLTREQLQPTALNKGLALPHTREFLLDAHYDVVTVVYPTKPIPYGALDGKPVHTLFFLFACEDRHHLHLLAKIAHLTNQPEILELIKTKPSKTKLLEYIKEWEGSIQKAAADECG